MRLKITIGPVYEISFHDRPHITMLSPGQFVYRMAPNFRSKKIS